MGNENTSRMVQATGMQTNQGEIARPPIVRFNIGIENSWFFSENRKPDSAVRNIITEEPSPVGSQNSAAKAGGGLRDPRGNVAVKLNNENEMRIQPLREHGCGAKAIKASYPNKNWSFARCKWSAVESMRRVQLWRVVQVAVGRSLCCCSWWTFWTLCLNTEWAANIHH